MGKNDIIKALKKEIKLWKDLGLYVEKKMNKKTYTKVLNKEIKDMIKERTIYLKNEEEVFKRDNKK